MPEVITDNLVLWTSALRTKSTAGRGSNGKPEAYGVKKLRALILELAVRGKLVQQDPNDEPADACLAKARLKLRAEGKGARRSAWKETALVSAEEKRFELPKGWAWARVNDTGFYVNGLAFKPTDWGVTGKPIIRIQNLTDPTKPLNYAQGEFPDEVTVRTGDLLVSWSATLDAFIWDRDEAVLNQHIFKVAGCHELVTHGFLYWLLKVSIREMEESDHAHGLVMTHINREPFLAHVVAIPPLAEQHRIVAKVDELMALCDQLEQQQTDSLAAHETLVETLLGTLTRVESQHEFSAAWARIASHFDTLFTTEASIDQLKQAILQLAVAGKLSFAEVSDKPISALLEEIMIERKQVGATKKELEYFEEECQEAKKSIAKNRVMLKTRFFCAFITKGTTPASTELLQTGDIPFLKVYNIVSNRIDFDYKPTFISKEVHESKLKRSVLFPGDVIMNIVGPPLRKVAIVPDQYPEWNMNQALAVFRPMGDIYNRYLFYMLSSETVLKTVLADVKGTAGQDNLSLEQCRDLLVPMPSVEEQHRMVAKVDELMALCDALKARLADAQTTQLHLADAIVEQAVC